MNGGVIVKIKKICKASPKKYNPGSSFGFSTSKQSSDSQSSSQGISPEALEEIKGLISGVKDFSGQINTGTVGLPDDEKLFGTASRRFLESSRSGNAARGLLTSGASNAIENQGLEQLATAFGEKEFDRSLQSAAFGREGAVQASTGFLDLIRSILGQTTTSQSTSTGSGSSLGVSASAGTA